MPYEFYKILHISSLILIFLAVGAMGAHALIGADKAPGLKKPLAITHGVALLLLLVSGFGLLAKLQVSFGAAMWPSLKVLVWLFFGGLSALVYRKSRRAKLWLGLAAAAGIVAAWLAISKPL